MLTTPNPTEAELVDLMESALTTAAAVCAELGDEDWARPTDCVAWDVRDQLSHLTDFEAVATGSPLAPEIDRAAFPHVTNDFQHATERGVQARRRTAPAEILAEFQQAIAERIPALRALSGDAWDAPMETPVGAVPTRAILPIRVLDVAFHEQDIRRATNRPGNLDGDVTRFVVARMATLAMPVIVGKHAGAPEGTIVHVRVDGPAGGEVLVAVKDGRGVLVDSGEPTVTITADVQMFLCLIGGRWTAERARTEGILKIEGDVALGEKIVASMSVLP
jgi:uncharacterized protein (TIGR03083 family)